MKMKQLNRLLLSIYSHIEDTIQSVMDYTYDEIGINKLPISSTTTITQTGVVTELEINVNNLKSGKKYCLVKDDDKSYASNLVIHFMSYQKSLGKYVQITNLAIDDFGAIISVDDDKEKKILNLYINNKRYEMNYNDCSSLNSIIITDYSNVDYLEIDNEVEYTPTKDYNPATKKYVDDKSPFKSITSTADNTITINELQTDSLYELNGTFKMFSSSESINLSGLFIFESIDNNTKALRKITNNGAITTTSYKLDVNTQTYTINKTQEIFYLTPENNIIYLENVGSGIYSTSALSARVNKSNNTEASLGVAGIKYLAITKARYNGDTIWTINVLGSVISNSKLTLKSDGTVVKEFYQYQTDRNVLTKDNIKEYTPTEDYHPTTKKYVDENYVSKKPNEFVITKNGSAVTIDLTTNTYDNYSSVYVNGEFVSNDSITINCPVPSDNTFNEMHIFFIIKSGEIFNNILFNSNTKYANLSNIESKPNSQLVEVILKKVYNFYNVESKVYLGPLGITN